MWKPFLFSLAALLLLQIGAPTQARAGSDYTPPPGRALICFYRETAFEGNWFHYKIFDNGRKVGTLGAGTYFNYLTTPGEHQFRTRLVFGSGTALHLRAGRVYFVRCDPGYEVLYQRPVLGTVTPAEGAAVVG